MDTAEVPVIETLKSVIVTVNVPQSEYSKIPCRDINAVALSMFLGYEWSFAFDKWNFRGGKLFFARVKKDGNPYDERRVENIWSWRTDGKFLPLIKKYTPKSTVTIEIKESK